MPDRALAWRWRLRWTLAVDSGEVPLSPERGTAELAAVRKAEPMLWLEWPWSKGPAA